VKKYVCLCGIYFTGDWWSRLWSWYEAIAPYDNIVLEQVDFPKLNQAVYLKKKNWGITGDGQATVISTSDERTVDTASQTDFSLYGLGHIFYRKSGDTLIVFTRHKFKEPAKFNSNIVIKQVELDNPSFQDLYERERNSVSRF
jgi:hypothetical protein